MAVAVAETRRVIPEGRLGPSRLPELFVFYSADRGYLVSGPGHQHPCPRIAAGGHVARLASRHVAEQFEFLLDRLEEYWRAVPDSIEDFEAWDLLDQLDLIVEWPIPTRFLRELNQLRDSGGLAEEQRRRYEEFSSLMARKQPTLDEILKPDPPRTDR